MTDIADTSPDDPGRGGVVEDADGSAEVPGAESTPTAGRRRLSPGARSAIEWVSVITGALIVAIVVKTFLIQAFYIPSESMVPTLEIGDRVLVNKRTGGSTDDLNRGDVVVFARPGGAASDGIRDLIKRVIALPGEQIEGRDGHVYIDGRRLKEPYLPDGVVTSTFGPVEIGEDEVWVMGDNREASDDSRRFGTIPMEDVVGRAFLIVWPVGDIGRL